MAFIRDWVAPASVTALVAWIFIPTIPLEPPTYDKIAQGQHRVCALEGHRQPDRESWYPPDEFTPLIPSLGGKIRVIEAHECLGSMNFTHLIVDIAGAGKASVLVTRSGEGGERTIGPRRFGDFEVMQVRTTRHRGFVVVDRAQAGRLREWRDLTIDRLRQFLRQSEGG
jgi:hypothetical protein